MSTWLTGKIVSVISDDTFEVSVERSGGPYATGLGAVERVKMVNHEVSPLRPGFMPAHGQHPLLGMRIYCEIQSRSHLGHYVVTARPG